MLVTANPLSSFSQCTTQVGLDKFYFGELLSAETAVTGSVTATLSSAHFLYSSFSCLSWNRVSIASAEMEEGFEWSVQVYRRLIPHYRSEYPPALHIDFPLSQWKVSQHC